MTRWTTRAKKENVVLSKTKELKKTLGLFVKDKSIIAETRAKRKVILPQFSAQKKMFGLQATCELVELLENLSVQLQTVGLTAVVAIFCIDSASAPLDGIRSDVEFESTLKCTHEIRGMIWPEPAAAPRRLMLDDTGVVITE